jgi:hypothetical protein
MICPRQPNQIDRISLRHQIGRQERTDRKPFVAASAREDDATPSSTPLGGEHVEGRLGARQQWRGHRGADIESRLNQPSCVECLL